MSEALGSHPEAHQQLWMNRSGVNQESVQKQNRAEPPFDPQKGVS